MRSQHGLSIEHTILSLMMIALLFGPTGVKAAYDLDFTVAVGSHKIAVSMAIDDIPDGNNKLPAVLIIPGAQFWDRDGNIPGNNYYGHYKDISVALVKKGFAVFRYDKRGLGESTGTSTFDRNELATDARAVFYEVQKRDEVDSKRIILLGHSQGTEVICKMMMDDHLIKPRAVALLSPTASVDEVVALMKAPVFLARGGKDGQIDELTYKLLISQLEEKGLKVTAVTVPNGSHLLFDVGRGEPNYDSDDTRVSNELLAPLVKWASGLR